MLSWIGNHMLEWWFMTRLSQYFFYFLFFIVLGGAVISRFLNSASFLWSPPLCGALRGSWGGDTHAHDMFRVTDGIPTFSFLPRYYSFPSRLFMLMWCIHASFITEWWSVRCALLLLAQRWRGTVPSTPHELQKPVKNQWMHLTSFSGKLSPWLQKSSFITLDYYEKHNSVFRSL